MKSIKVCIMLLMLPFEALNQNLIEVYNRKGFHNSATIELYDDNTFIEKGNLIGCVMDSSGIIPTSRYVTFGKFEINNRRIKFRPNRKLSKLNSDIKLKETDKIPKLSSYEIVEYKGRKLLFANKMELSNYRVQHRFENHFIYIANRINERDTVTIFDSEFWRSTNEKERNIIIDKDIKEIYPEGYRGYILKEPLVGHVKNVQEVSFFHLDKESNPEWKKYRITLDIGSNEGVKPMMVFYGKKNCNNRRCEILIVDVTEEESSGYIENYSYHYNCSEEKIFSTKK